MSELAKLAAGAAIGAVMGWTGHTLTFIGRLDAVEKTLSRIELRLDTVAPTKAAP